MSSALFDFVIPFIVVLGVLVFIHELGHHLAAKIFGMKVDVFSLGFPPRAWGFRWGSKRLRPKFMLDIATAIKSNATFVSLNDRLVSKRLSDNPDDSIRIIADIFKVEVTETKIQALNKKGKPVEQIESRTNVLVTESVTTKKIGSDELESMYKIFTSDTELVDSFYRRYEINDDKIFNEKYRTDYCISWIPLGGYCKINGMVDESFDIESMKEGTPKPWEYRAKPIWQRIIAISGGVLFNFLLAVVIFASVAFINGLPDMDKYKAYKLGTIIQTVNPGSPAEKAGLKSGDKIISINQTPVEEWTKLVEIIHSRPEEKVTVQWKRGEEELTAEIVPNRVKIQTPDGLKEVGQIGIGPSQLPEFTRESSLLESIQFGFMNTYRVSALILVSIKQIIMGEQSFKDSMGGPIAIVKMTGEVKQQQGWAGIVGFMALLSISLAVFNLFPIPALDGGHLMFLIVEAIIRRPLSIKFKLYAQQVGMAILLSFIAYVTFNDIMK
jgi:regulator of sigma E protease